MLMGRMRAKGSSENGREEEKEKKRGKRCREAGLPVSQNSNLIIYKKSQRLRDHVCAHDFLCCCVSVQYHHWEELSSCLGHFGRPSHLQGCLRVKVWF